MSAAPPSIWDEPAEARTDRLAGPSRGRGPAGAAWQGLVLESRACHHLRLGLTVTVRHRTSWQAVSISLET